MWDPSDGDGSCSYAYYQSYDRYEGRRLPPDRGDRRGWPAPTLDRRGEGLDREVDAPAGTTVFVPAGSPHTYRVTEPSRCLISLTPRLDRLIAKLRSLSEQSGLRATLTEFDTVLVE